MKQTIKGNAQKEWKQGDVILGLYEVKNVLGEGGMGKVYRVYHPDWHIDLAMKSPLPNTLAKDGGKENFIREAETWVNLGLHPHTVSCYYVRDDAGTPRVFAECVEGGSLSDWICKRESSQLPKLYEGGVEKSLERILDIAIQFAWGLHYAHEQGLVHQDVKPGNVMMTPEGVAKVTDFGLAQGRTVAGEVSEHIESGKSVEVAGIGMMTRAYASPEQAACQPLTRKTDIWSWGVSVLEMFYGETPCLYGRLAAEVLEAAHQVSEAGENYIPTMPSALTALLRRCFQKDPAQRPKDMLVIAGALAEIYQQVTGQAYPRQLPKALKLIADSLNNRAVSLLDLGKQEEAERLWEEALRIQPFHPEATYNYGLLLWRSCRRDDIELIGQVKEARKSLGDEWRGGYLLGLVHLERDDADAAVAALSLESIRGMGGASDELRRTLAIARERSSYSKRLLHTFKGHTHWVMSACFSRNGRYALSGGYYDKVLKLWEVGTGRCLKTFERREAYKDIREAAADNGFVKSVDLSFDGRSALSGSADGMVRLWDVETGRCLRIFEGQNMLSGNAVCFSRDARYVLFDVYMTVELWEIGTGRLVRTFEGHTGSVQSLVLSNDGRYALSGSSDRTFKLWEVATGRCLRTFEGHTSWVESVSLNPNGRYALSGSWDKTIKLWEVETGRCIRTIAGHTGIVGAVSFSPDGRFALSGSNDNMLKLWELETGRCLRTFEGHTGQVRSVSLSSDGQYALSASDDTTLKLWKINSSAEYRAPIVLSQIVASETAARSEAEHEASIALAREALKSENFITAAQHIKQARAYSGYERSAEAVTMWEGLYQRLPRKALKGGWEKATLKGHTQTVRSVVISYDGKYALSGSHDMTLKLWDIEAGRLVRTFDKSEHNGNSISLCTDQQYALSGGGGLRKNDVLKLWKVDTGRCLYTFNDHTNAVHSITFNFDGRYVLYGGHDWSGENKKTLMLWDAKTRRHVRTFEGHRDGVRSVSFSHDGQYALSGAGQHDRTLRLWDVKTGHCLRTFVGHADGVKSVSLSHDGQYALSGSDDMTLKLWDTQTGLCLITLEGHTASVTSVSLNLGGKYALSGSADRTLKLWELATGRCLWTFEGHTGGVNSVSLSLDGRYALSASDDKTLKLWFLDWELEGREIADWDERARPYLKTFLMQHTRYAAVVPRDHEPTEEEITLALTRRGKPEWSENDFKRLLYILGCVGYGWLRPESVRRKLEEMVVKWTDPPSLI